LFWSIGWLLGWTASDSLNIPELDNRTALTVSIIPAVIFPQFSIPLGIIGGAFANNSSTRKGVVAVHSHSPSKFSSWNGTVLLRVTGWPTQKSTGWQAAAVIVSIDSLAEYSTVKPVEMDGILLSGKGDIPELWDIIACSMQGKVPRRESVAGGFSMRKYLIGRGIKWTGKLDNYEILHAQQTDVLSLPSDRLLAPVRYESLQIIDSYLPRRESLLFASVLFADKNSDSRIVKSSFAATGTAHLFAVSGLHVGILVSVLIAIASLLPIPKRITHFLILIAVYYYTILAGLPVSAVRAATFAALTLLASQFGRKSDSLHILSIIFVMAVMWYPESTADVGLQLSFIATGVILVGSRYTKRLKQQQNRAKPLITLLFVSTVAYWGTLPIIARYFGSINILAPMINCVAIPIFSAGVWLTFIALLIPISFIQESLLALGWLPIRLTEVAINWVSNIDVLQMTICVDSILKISIYLLITGVVLAIAKTPIRFAISIILMTVTVPVFNPSLFTKSESEMTVIQFDIGQGDCALFRFPDGSNVVIDTGAGWQGGDSFSRGPLQWIRRQGITKISDLLMTHNHLDHTGGTTSLLSAFEVETIWCGGDSHQSIVDDFQKPAAGDTIQSSSDWSLVCLYPGSDYEDHNENNNSTVVGLYFEKSLKGVWTGDLEIEGEEHYLATVINSESLDVLKAGHHGSSTSSSIDFLSYFSPDNILISCGVENRHKHPSHGPFYTAQDTIKLHRTDFGGSQTVKWSKTGQFKGIEPTFLDTMHVDSYYPVNSSTI